VFVLFFSCKTMPENHLTLSDNADFKGTKYILSGSKWNNVELMGDTLYYKYHNTGESTIFSHGCLHTPGKLN